MTTQPLKQLYNLAEDQGLIEHGLQWYPKANDYAAELALAYSVSLDKVAQIIAILSPAVSWAVNKRDAESLLRLGERATVSTYGQNKSKALGVLWDLDQINPKALKTFSFYNNILKPKASADYVTIDRHAIKAYKGLKKAGSVQITPKLYKTAANSYKRFAKALAIEPCELQAIIWLSYRANVLGFNNDL